MTDIERLPCGVEHELRTDAAIIRGWIDVANGPINREALADRLNRYANAAAELTAEIEALRAEVAAWRKLSDRMEAVLDQLQAEIERLRAEVELWRHKAAIHKYRRNRLAEALREARDAIEDWAGYASDYFREKHDLAGDLAKIDALLREQEEGHEQ